MSEHAWSLNRTEGGGRDAAVELAGRLTFAEAGALWAELNGAVSSAAEGQRIDFDMSKVEGVDGGSMALLVQLRADLHRKGTSSELIGASEAIQAIIHLYRGDVLVGPLKKLRATGMLEQIGAATSAILDGFKQVFGFFGQALMATAAVVRRPGTANWGEIAPMMERAGADAFPIVMLINFLVGRVMAFQGAVQLRQFGANTCVANLTGLAICRELGPLMTAITLCGRSGAAFAASTAR